MNARETEPEKWSLVLVPKKKWFDFDLRNLWRYRELILLFVKRDFVAFYKQTILGPLWYLIQPLLVTIVFTVIFGKVAKVPTDGSPNFIFFLSGIVVWSYFANCLNETSRTFIKNAAIFGKVYFPRLTMPISVVIINLVKLGIQILLFLGFYMYFISRDPSIRPNLFILLIPVLIFQMALLGLGAGILVSSLTTKYRDLSFLMTFAVQLWMYATPVVYPASLVPGKWRFVYMLNPMSSVVETFRYAFLGRGVLNPVYISTSWAVTLLILICGILLFTRIEKSFMDTV